MHVLTIIGKMSVRIAQCHSTREEGFAHVDVNRHLRHQTAHLNEDWMLPYLVRQGKPKLIDDERRFRADVGTPVAEVRRYRVVEVCVALTGLLDARIEPFDQGFDEAFRSDGCRDFGDCLG